MTGRPFTTILCLTLLWTAPVLAAAPVSEVMVEKDTVTLGELFSGVSTETAGRAVMAAPAAGRDIVLDARTLASLAARNGISWKPQTGYEFAKVSRASQRFTATDIADALLPLLKVPAVTSARTQLKLDNTDLVLHAPLSTPVDLTFANISQDASGQRFSATAKLMVGPQLVSQAQIGGRIVTMADIPVVTRPLRRGEMIRAEDLSWQEIEVSNATAGLIFNAEDIIGKSPRTALRPGASLRPADLVTPPAIARGTLVTMLYRVGGLQITAQGRALGDAQVGESLRVVNLSSSRTIEGIVESPGVVRFGPAPAPVTTN